MEISRKACRVCLSETEFNVSLFDSYCRRTNMIDKLLVCLKLVIEETDTLHTICYKCAENVERYYNFMIFVKKSQMRLAEPRQNVEGSVNRRHVTSYVREEVIDADYTFSFLEIPNEKKESKCSSPFFSYFSPASVLMMPNKGEQDEKSSQFFSHFKHSEKEHVWKTPRPLESFEKDLRREDKKGYKRHRRQSRDLFDSQSQDVEDPETRPLDWKLTPDDNIIRRVRDKCFGRSDF